MTIPVSNPVVSEISSSSAAANSSSLSGSTAATSGTHTIMSMEEVVAMIRRLEARFEEREERNKPQQPPRPPDPEPPYGMPKGWRSPSWCPGGSASSAAEPSFTYTPALTTTCSGGSTTSGDRSGLGFSQHQIGPRFTPSVSAQPWAQSSHPWAPPSQQWAASSQAATSSWDLPPPQPTSSWDLPPSRTTWEQQGQRFQSGPATADPTKLFRLDPPVFDGTEAQSWVTRVQYFFDHIRLPEEHRLHYVVMLFAPPTTDWIFSYRANNQSVSWSKFLDDVRRRFDPNYFVNYIELIAKLS